MSTLNRRAGVIAGLVSIIALMSKQARAEEASGSLYLGTGLVMPKAGVTFAVDFYTHYTFTFGGETVTLTPQEVWAALRSKEGRP